MIGNVRRLFWSLFPVLCLMILLMHCMRIGKDFREYHQADREYEDWADHTKEERDGDSLESTIDFERLQKRNPDIVAWIHIPDTNMDYPVVQGSDNTYYLNHTAAGRETSSGAIFLDAGSIIEENTPDEFFGNSLSAPVKGREAARKEDRFETTSYCFTRN